MERLLYESHMHTPLCRHAVGEPEEYAQVAEQQGLKGILVTCHCPLPRNISRGVRMIPEELDDYVALVERARQTWAGHIDIRLGLESDFLPGLEPWLAELHGRLPLHHVLGSVHPQLSPYFETYFQHNWLEYQRTYFRHLAEAAETGLYDTLAHPDLVKNCAPQEWQLERILPHLCEALDRIAKTGVAMELNTSGLNKAIPEMNPGRPILELIFQRNIPVVLGSDAHHPSRVGDRFHQALDQLESIGFREIHFFLERKRQTVPIAEARASLSSANQPVSNP